MSSNPIAIDGAFTIYSYQIKQWRADSARSLKQYLYRKHPLYKQMAEWFTIRCLLVVATTLLVTKVTA